MYSLHRFYFDAIVKCRKNPSWRYGQAMFNHLCECRPDLSEQVRGTSMDPFYCSSPQDERFDRFVSFIEKNWYNNTEDTDTSYEQDQTEL